MLNHPSSLARRFAADRRGTIAIIFALAFIPVLGLAGAAIDFTRAHTARTKLQYALDAAVLAAGSSNTLTNEERIERARKLFDANYEQDATPVEPTISIGDDGVITASVDYSMDTLILGVLGVDEMNIGTVSEAKVGTMLEGEIVLVLDYSLSMDSSGKYQAMRDAAIELIDVISQNGENTEVKFGLVPFSGKVYTTLPKQFVFDESGGGNWTSCTADRKWPHNTTNMTPTSDDDTKWGIPVPGGGGWGWGGGWGGSLCSSDPGCSTYAHRNAVIRPLSDDFTAVTDHLQSIQPVGCTHISLGLEFGWHLLSPNAPFTDATAYGDEDLVKAIVLLTDGEQTSGGWGPGGDHSVGDAEDNLTELCTEIKDMGVTLVTMTFDVSHQPTIDRMRDCATSHGHFFDARTNTELAHAFQVVTGHLVKSLHLSK